MELYRIGNVQSVEYNDKIYYRVEYTDELSYMEWWERADRQMCKIEDECLSVELEKIFSSKYPELVYDPMDNFTFPN